MTRAAIERVIANPDTLDFENLFTAEEQGQIAASIEAANATANLLGRSVVAEHAARLRRRDVEEFADPPEQPLRPQYAIDHFQRLVPTLGVDPKRFGADQRRTAFQVAESTSLQLTRRLKSLLSTELQEGKSGWRDATPQLIDKVLADAGVSPKNPQYGEMVYRTNMMDEYNTGAHDELQQHTDVFPVWQYLNPDDVRSRPHHAAKNLLYWGADVAFNIVRGTEASDVCNCRCSFRPVDKWEWEELRKKGARLESGTDGRGTSVPRKTPSTEEKQLRSSVEVADDAFVRKGDIEKRVADIIPGRTSETKLRTVAELIGDPPGAKVVVADTDDLNFYDNDGSKESMKAVIVKAKGDGYRMERLIGETESGRKFIFNEIFYVEPGKQGQGLGVDIFSSQVRAAADNGFEAIKTYAARGATENGYYTWARFGYDAPLSSLPDEGLIQEIKTLFPKANNVSDLMMTPEGRDYWKKNGVSIPEATFDLKEGSLSRRILDAYLEERKNRPTKMADQLVSFTAAQLLAEEEAALDRAWARIAAEDAATHGTNVPSTVDAMASLS